MRIILLCGLPGAGKTTWAKQQAKDFYIINQDELGSRDHCAQKALDIIKIGRDIIIDRTNIDKRQRSNWIKLAKHHGISEIECVEFKSDPEKCIKRIKNRQNHPTIPPNTSVDKIAQIVRKFNKAYERPTHDEGFFKITVISVDNFPSSSEDDKSFISRYWTGFKSLFNFFPRS